MGFADALGIADKQLRWDIPLPSPALAYAEHLIPDKQPTLVISACSSHALRNWLPERYAAVADHAVNTHGMRVILAGGPSAVERDMAAAIVRHARVPLVNQVAKDTLPQLLALLARATVLLDAGFGSGAHGDHGRNAGDRALCCDESAAQRAVPFAPLVRRCLRCGGAEISRETGERAALDDEDRAPGGHGFDRSAGSHRQAR